MRLHTIYERCIARFEEPRVKALHNLKRRLVMAPNFERNIQASITLARQFLA